MTSLSHLTKRAARACGLDIRRAHNVPELTFLGLLPPAPELVLDVGANDGGFLDYACHLFPHARFHCFEPLVEPRERLEAQLRSGRIKADARIWPFALGERGAVLAFNRHMDHSASSSFLQASELSKALYPQTQRIEASSVEVKSLDEWVHEQQLEMPARSLLKLDVQGFEAQVLRGGTQALRKIGICIVEVCVAPLYAAQSTFSDIVALLASADLTYIGNLDQVHDPSGRPIFLDAVFARGEHAHWPGDGGLAS